MNDHFRAVFATPKNGKYLIKCINAFNYGSSKKILEHSFTDNKFVQILESQIADNPSIVVWAGNNASPETSGIFYDEVIENNYTPNSSFNLYRLCDRINHVTKEIPQTEYYQYIVNDTRKEYIDKNKYKNHLHPLPLLTRDTFIRQLNNNVCCLWSRNLIYATNKTPSLEYNELVNRSTGGILFKDDTDSDTNSETDTTTTASTDLYSTTDDSDTSE